MKSEFQVCRLHCQISYPSMGCCAAAVFHVCRWLAGRRSFIASIVHGRRADQFWDRRYARGATATNDRSADGGHRGRDRPPGRPVNARIGSACRYRKNVDRMPAILHAFGRSLDCARADNPRGNPGNDRARRLVDRCPAIRQKAHRPLRAVRSPKSGTLPLSIRVNRRPD